MKKIFFYSPEGSWSNICEQGLRDSIIAHGEEVGIEVTPFSKEADIIFISAGAPIWASIRFDDSFLKEIRESSQIVVIGEQHEYGWKSHAEGACRIIPTYDRQDVQNFISDSVQYQYEPLQELLIGFLAKGRPFLYLKREYMRGGEYPDYVFPFNFVCRNVPPVCSFEDFMSRSHNCAVIWGESNPHRKLIIEALEKASFSKVFLKTVINPDTAYSGEEYRKIHLNARSFISCDGHGLGDARIVELSPIAAPFRKQSLMITRDDLIDGHSVVEFPLLYERDEMNLRLPDLDSLFEKMEYYFNRPELLYGIYVNANRHMQKYHSLKGNAYYLKHLLEREGLLTKRSYTSETSLCRQRLSEYCRGNGLDLGYGGDAISPSAITVDLERPYTQVGEMPLHLKGDALDLHWFKDNSLDYVYSSHLLEDFENTETVLREWIRVLKPGGNLVIYCPDEQRYRKHCQETGQPYNQAHKIENFSYNYLWEVLRNIGGMEIIYSNDPADIYSFELVARKC